MLKFNYYAPLLLFYIFPLFADAHNISIDTNGYTGLYRLNSGSFVTGNQSINLPTGTHTFWNYPGSYFHFDVDSAGNITSQNNGIATGMGSTLVLSTTTLTINPGKYTGYWFLGGYGLAIGTQTFTVITNISDRIYNNIGATICNFEISSSGLVTPINNSQAITLSSNHIYFKTIDLTVDPGLFTGSYVMTGGVGYGPYSGVQKLTVIPGASARLGYAGGGTITNFEVDVDGNISHYPANMMIGPWKLTFKTVDLKIYPGLYPGLYTTLGYINPGMSGERTIKVVPQADDRIILSASSYMTDFTIGDNGDVTLYYQYVPDSIKHEKNALFFRNQKVSITKPSAFSGLYGVYQVESGVGSTQTTNLIPGAPFYFTNGNLYPFTLNNCLNDINFSTGYGTFTMSCALTDNFKWVGIDPTKFNSINTNLQIQNITGEYATAPIENNISINGDPKVIIEENVTKYLFNWSGFLNNGRNLIEISGNDVNSNPFSDSVVLWAGNNELIVYTGNSSTNYDVTLTVLQSISGNTYTFSQTQTTVGGKTTFKNVPSLQTEITHSVKERLDSPLKINLTGNAKVNLRSRRVSFY